MNAQFMWIVISNLQKLVVWKQWSMDVLELGISTPRDWKTQFIWIMYYNLRTKLLKAIFAGNNLLNSVTNFHYFLAKYVRNSNNCLGKKESIFKTFWMIWLFANWNDVGKSKQSRNHGNSVSEATVEFFLQKYRTKLLLFYVLCLYKPNIENGGYKYNRKW